MEYLLQIHINQHSEDKDMYNSPPTPSGLQVTTKTASFYCLYSLVYFFRKNQLNM